MSVLPAVQALQSQLENAVIGQPLLVNRLLLALLVDGHLLVEGAPGLAKTRAIKALADHIESNYQRVQFTPDLLPADLTGTEVYRPADGSFVFQEGPLFNNLILADEVNRAPAKVQSALLEAMAEQQISVCLACAIHGYGDTKSDRAGRYLSLARSTTGSFSDAGDH